MGVVVGENSLHEQADVALRESATFGMVASLAFHKAAVKGALAVSGYSALRMSNPVTFECLECSEPWRLGISHKSSNNVTSADVALAFRIYGDDFIAEAAMLYSIYKSRSPRPASDCRRSACNMGRIL